MRPTAILSMRRGYCRALSSATTSMTTLRRYRRFSHTIRPKPQTNNAVLRCILSASSNHPFVASLQWLDLGPSTPTQRASLSTATMYSQSDHNAELARKEAAGATKLKVMDTESSSSIQEAAATKDKEVPPTKSLSRPMTARERMVTFPANVYQLMLDVYRYRDIQACAASPAPNSWQGRIPRQQREQQRLLREGAGIVVPLVVLWIPPIIGYIPMALAVSAPRQVLSRHFHNPYEQRQYILWQHQQRMRYWKNGSFLSIVQRSSTENNPTAGAKSTRVVDQLSRGETIALALAMGVGSSFPEPIPRLAATALSAPYCRRQIRYLLRSIAEDDLCIQQEVETSCSSNSSPLDARVAVYLQAWSDIELLDACYLRGLALRDESTSASATACEHLPSRACLIEQLQKHISFYISDHLSMQHKSVQDDALSQMDGEERSLRLWFRNIKQQQQAQKQKSP